MSFITEKFSSFDIKTISDIGYGLDDHLFDINDYKNKEKKFYLFEPNIFLFKDLIVKFKDFDNVCLYNYGIYNDNKIVNFYLDHYWSFIEGINAPIYANQKNNIERILKFHKVLINAYKISVFDKGNIDFLSLSCEGCEWFCLEHLVSRPKIIRINNFNNSGYNNFFQKNIEKWIKENNYVLDFIENPVDCYYDYFYIKKE